MKKKVLVISGSRGEYGYIRPFLLKTRDSSTIEADVFLTNMHLLQDYGMTVNEFAEDNIPVKHKCLNTLSGDSDYSMIKSLFIFGLTLSDILATQSYDFLLLAGDRGEQLISAITGFHMRVPTIHIQAGERSGHVDGMSRHAIARFSHLHICANLDSANRLERFGEELFRIKMYGAPQLDEIFHHKPMTDVTLSNYVGNIPQKFCLFVYHPTSEELLMAANTCENILEYLFNKGLFVIAISPNSDAGSGLIRNVLSSRKTKNLRVFNSLSREPFLELVRRSYCIVGNSSCGLLEAPVFGTPAINVGNRQHNRVMGSNVICVPAKPSDPDLDHAFSRINDYDRVPNSPYGDGLSTDRIIKLIEDTNISPEFLNKSITS